jgi:hypothetical protein
MKNTNTHTNPELELAHQYVCFTNRSIFLTGKAGTGKTTFLHRLKDNPPKRLAVVAPTGVAAINAGGQTIHSLFQLPFGPIIPGNKNDAARQRRFRRNKIKLIKSLDLLIIDEISMVRADLLDGIDEVLRRFRSPFLPFGGLQLLMIGDLHQLPPVVKDQDWDLLREHYPTPYFFSSLALRQTNPITIQLKHIYRQSDDSFIRLLNKVRNNQMSEEVLRQLNSRYQPISEIPDEEAYITLTSHNATAQQINQEKLNALPRELHRFQAEISGDFPAHAYPAEEILEVKPGAQVMFIKNDPTAEKRYYNGKIGKITRIIDQDIYVQCPDEQEEIAVMPVEWSNRKYKLNAANKEVEEDIVGTFEQYPLRLAWAITIHKSQGLTFEKVILDAQAAFAHGQVYVALSRCKTFEGIVLRSKINYSSVRTDSKVKRFSEEAEKKAPDQQQLNQDKAAFQQSLMLELFGFKALGRYMERMKRVLLEHEKSLLPGAIEPYQQLRQQLDGEALPVEQKFQRQLQAYFRQGGMPEDNQALQERIQKASHWFEKLFREKLLPTADEIKLITDNQKVKKTAEEALDNLQRALFSKLVCFQHAQEGFSAQLYQQVKANADIDFENRKDRRSAGQRPAIRVQDSPHPELYRRLVKWRAQLADERELLHYQILPTRALLSIAEQLPGSKKTLKKIHGIGKTRLAEYGESLISIVSDYCTENNLEAAIELPEQPALKPVKPDTKAQTLALYKTGKSIEEIAEARGLVSSTIEGHLTHFIKTGELAATDFLSEAAIQEISAYMDTLSELKLSSVKAHFGEAYSYGQLRMASAQRERDQAESAE